MGDVSLIAAFFAGVLALLSPCSALLLPSFFAYAFANPAQLLARTAVFYVGLAATLVPLGTGASMVSTLFYGHRAELILWAGWAIIALGILQLLGGGFAIPGVSRVHAWVMGRGGKGWVTTFALGAVYGLAGFCSGPVLGAILTVAAMQGSALAGGFLLAVYALGMAAPLFVLALVWNRWDLGRRGWLRGRAIRVGPIQTHTTSVVSGLLFIAIGALFLSFDGTAGLMGALGFADTTDLEYDAQNWLMEWGNAIPVWVLPLIVAVIAAGVAWRRAFTSSDDATSHREADANAPQGEADAAPSEAAESTTSRHSG